MCLEISRGIYGNHVWVLKNLLIPIATNPCVAKLLELMMDETTPSTYFNGISELKCQVCYMHFLTIWAIFFQLCNVTTKQSCICGYAFFFGQHILLFKYNQTRYACHWCWNHKQLFLCFPWNFGNFCWEFNDFLNFFARIWKQNPN